MSIAPNYHQTVLSCKKIFTARGLVKSPPDGENMDMADEDKEIRIHNASLLIKLKAAGSLTEFAKLTGKLQSYWSDVMRNEKSFGPKAGRMLENKLQLPKGWIEVDRRHVQSLDGPDQDHSAEITKPSTHLEFRPWAFSPNPRDDGRLMEALEPPSLSGNFPVRSWDGHEGLPQGFVAVPRLRMSLSMGTGKIMFEAEEHEEGNAFRADWLATMCLKPGSCFMAKVEGASMEPKLEEGESVLIDRAQTLIIDRKIYAVSYDGKIYCKRLFKAGGEVIMRSDNFEFPEIRAPAEEVQIIGRVVWHAGNC
ncbi:MAG: S24 family peptidase [Acidithiobacillus ferriphilus]